MGKLSATSLDSVICELAGHLASVSSASWLTRVYIKGPTVQGERST